jgi:hypothetical protein
MPYPETSSAMHILHTVENVELEDMMQREAQLCKITKQKQ